MIMFLTNRAAPLLHDIQITCTLLFKGLESVKVTVKTSKNRFLFQINVVLLSCQFTKESWKNVSQFLQKYEAEPLFSTLIITRDAS